jgi:DHA2 family multidrug resistance protein
VGRLIGRVDLRLLLLAGFGINVLALWEMTQYSLDLSQGNVIWPSVIQGIGTGLVFVPLSAATFATLSSQMRAQGTAIFSLVRNIGSSIGISLVQTVLVRNTVAVHAALVEKITTSSPAWNNPGVARIYDLSRPAGAAALDALILEQSSMIAYINDFRLMLYLTIAVIPLILFIRPPRRSDAPIETHAVVE